MRFFYYYYYHSFLVYVENQDFFFFWGNLIQLYVVHLLFIICIWKIHNLHCTSNVNFIVDKQNVYNIAHIFKSVYGKFLVYIVLAMLNYFVSIEN